MQICLYLLAVRSIPACAGETYAGIGRSSLLAVYPRVCGGNWSHNSHTTMVQGLSPRVRGKHPDHIPLANGGGSIPACAGETQDTETNRCEPKVYPRVCGGNCGGTPLHDVEQGLSPRVRGKRFQLRHRECGQ